MAQSHLYRFANDALPTTVFENPLAFVRAIASPQKAMGMLAATWDAAGGRLAGADRQDRFGMTAAIVRAEPFTVVHIQPPLAREVADACTIVVVGRGELQETFKLDYSYRNVIRPLVRALLDDRGGEPRVNAHAALALISDIRRVDRDPAWATLEAECRTRL